MTRALILGGGMVGEAMAMDLASDDDFDVAVADVRGDVLGNLAARYRVTTIQADLANPDQVLRLARDADIVLGALSSHIGLQTLETMLAARKPYVDISFMAEDPLQFRQQAVRTGVPMVVDCGVAPGSSNMIAGYAAAALEPCDALEIFVGGVPAERRWPFEFKVGFAPSDVIEEYTRPARVVEYGRITTYPALSGVELVDVPGLGTLEAFNTDGLRTLMETLDVPHMTEKTLRYPGHAALMRVLREVGFFSTDPIEIDGQWVRPLSLTSALVFPKWTYQDGEVDLTVLRIEARGRQRGRPVTLRWNMIDHFDPVTGLRSMSRTTAFPATIVARLIVSGRFTEPGLHPPEVLGAVDGLLDEVLAGLRLRGVDFRFERVTA